MATPDDSPERRFMAARRDHASDYQATVTALNQLHQALTDADIPDADIRRLPMSIAVVSGTPRAHLADGDYVIWWQNLGGTHGHWKLEGAGASHRAGTIPQVVETIRRLTAP